MIYIITDREIKAYECLEDINEEDNLLIDKEELHSIGADYIVKLTNKDIDFLIDKNKISNLVFEKLYGRNTKQQKSNNKKTLLYFGVGSLLLFSICCNAVLIGLML